LPLSWLSLTAKELTFYVKTDRFRIMTKEISLKKLDYWEVIVFYAPLLLTTGIMTLSAPFLNYGMGKSTDPELALAAFAAAFSVMIVVHSPIFTSISVFIAHLKDKNSLTTILKFFFFVSSASSATLFLIGYSKFGDFIFSSILQVRQDVASEAKQYILYISPIPLFTLFRCAYAGLATVYKKTHYLAIGTTLKLLTTSILVILLISAYPNKPGSCAATAFGCAIIVELLFLYFATRKLHSFSTPTTVSSYDFKLTPKYIVKFAAPIWASALAWTLSFPLINFVLGFSVNNTVGLAGFGVLRSILVFLGSPLFSIKTVVMVLGKDITDRKLIMRFSFLIASFATLIVATINFTELKRVILMDIFNLSEITYQWASEAFILIIVIPLLTAFRSFPEGMFIRDKKTNSIGVAGISRILSIALSGFLLLHLFPEINGVLLGVSLMLVASISDAIILLLALFIRKKRLMLTPGNEYA
jgi:hypothetical protein